MLYGRWALTAPSNPNVGGTGVDWEISAVYHEDTAVAYRDSDDYVKFAYPGTYLIQGHLILTPDAARESVEIRAVKNTTITRIIGHTSASVAASHRIIGHFQTVLSFVVDDVLKIKTILQNSAGTLTPVVDSGIDSSELVVMYIGEYA